MRATVLPGSALEFLTRNRTEEQIEFMRTVLNRGFTSLIEEGGNPSDIYHSGIKVFGENLLIETGIAELCYNADKENK